MRQPKDKKEPDGPRPISEAEARELLASEGAETMELFGRAFRVRRQVKGDTFEFCAIVNAKSGGCVQDCAFCAQSVHNPAVIAEYPLKRPETILAAAEKAAGDGACRFSIVTSGRAVAQDDEVTAIARTIELIREKLPLAVCASLGMVEDAVLDRLTAVGLSRFHHNLETAASYFGRICTTQRYDDSLETIERARRHGLSVCAGGIFGMGETDAQRVELLSTLRGLEVDSLPLNFLNPIAGTPLAGLAALDPLTCLKLVAVARLMMPHTEIRVAGGRERNLRDLQSWLLMAGIDGLMIGDYLTTAGRDPRRDREMVADVGFRVQRGQECVKKKEMSGKEPNAG